jgi:hemerythrin-like domain-containing protein
MPLTLFESTTADFNDPIGLLTACHSRIERQCATLLRLPDHLAHYGPDTQARKAAENALKYFNTSGKHHHADEEEDLFPLLAEAASLQQNRTVLDLIDELLTEHGEMESAWSLLAPLLEAVAEGGQVDPYQLPVESFAASYRSHMAKENDTLFPYARHTLLPEQIVILGQHMAQRRNPTPDKPNEQV